MKSALLLGVVLLASTVEAQPVRIISDRPLSGDATRALDVRWAPNDSLYVASYSSGVLQVAADSGVSRRVAFAEPGKRCPSCAILGVSPTHIVTSFPVHQVAWKATDKPQIHNYMFDAVVDLDVHEDRVLMLGSRIEDKKWAPDGAIAWMGSLSRGLRDLRPVLYSSRGAKGMTIARCGFLEPGAVRFFADGSYVVVPGVEPDIYLYEKSGKLAHTWQTGKLGFLDRCDLPEAQVQALSADPEQRARWRSKRTMVDDVLPTPAGPALILHRVQEGVAHWSMLILQRDRPPRRIELPFSARSDVASLRADIRGNRIAFLIRTFGEWRPNAKPVPARLIIAELR
jgi:hypothetical protein